MSGWEWEGGREEGRKGGALPGGSTGPYCVAELLLLLLLLLLLQLHHLR